VNDILPWVANGTKEKFILSTFKPCHSCIISFDLWMSRAKVDTFVMIVHFLSDKWEPYHIAVDFFEIVNTSGNAMVLKSVYCLLFTILHPFGTKESIRRKVDHGGQIVF
jgi:hypothetical protein